MKVVLSSHDLHNIFQYVVLLDPVVLYEWSVPVPVKPLSLPDTKGGDNTDGDRFDRIHVCLVLWFFGKSHMTLKIQDMKREIGVEFKLCNAGRRCEKVSQ